METGVVVSSSRRSAGRSIFPIPRVYTRSINIIYVYIIFQYLNNRLTFFFVCFLLRTIS